jgi:hypothetical protein
VTISADDDGQAPLGPRPLARASIITPGDWIELDLDPATRHASISRAVRQAVVRSRSLAPDAVRLIALLDRTSRQAVESGAFYCASRVIEDATGGVLVATVLMQICRSSMPPPGMPNPRAGEQCAGLASVISNDPGWAGADVRVVPLPFVGPAVRVHVEDSAIIVQYFVPLIGGFANAVLTFTCPCPPYARVMTKLFDTMAEGLVLHYE